MKMKSSLLSRPIILFLFTSFALPAGILLFTTAESPAPIAARRPHPALRPGPVGPGPVRPGIVRPGVSPGVGLVRRTGRYVYQLPYGCQSGYIDRVLYYNCGGYWYQPVYQGATLVYVEVVF